MRGTSSVKCQARGGTFYENLETAQQACRRPVQEPKSEGWCCIDGEAQMMTKNLCTEKGGQYFENPKQIKAFCRPKVVQRASQEWCCIDGTLLSIGKPQCLEQGGTYYDTKEEAQQSCVHRIKIMKPEGWCCIDGNLSANSKNPCNARFGSYFQDHQKAQTSCSKMATAAGWCCRKGILHREGKEECQTSSDTFYSNYFIAQQKCITQAEGLQKNVVEALPSLLTMQKSTIKIEDVSPGPGSTAESFPSYSIFGKMMAHTASGIEKLQGPPASWTILPELKTTTAIEPLAVRGANNNLFFFFFTDKYDWIAHNLTEQTGYKISGMPVGWARMKGFIFDQYIAAAGIDGSLLVFHIKWGTGWIAENISAKTGHKIIGDLTYWETTDGNNRVDHIAAQNPEGRLLVFYRVGEGTWKVIDVTEKTGHKIASSAVSWQTPNGPYIVEHLAAESTDGDLIVFYWQSGSDWKAINVSEKTGTKITGSATAWQTPNGEQIVEHLAAQSRTGELLVFYWQSDNDWKVVNVTAKTGLKITSVPTSWQTPNGQKIVEHLGARVRTSVSMIFTGNPVPIGKQSMYLERPVKKSPALPQPGCHISISSLLSISQQ